MFHPELSGKKYLRSEVCPDRRISFARQGRNARLLHSVFRFRPREERNREGDQGHDPVSSRPFRDRWGDHEFVK